MYFRLIKNWLLIVAFIFFTGCIEIETFIVDTPQPIVPGSTIMLKITGSSNQASGNQFGDTGKHYSLVLQLPNGWEFVSGEVSFVSQTTKTFSLYENSIYASKYTPEDGYYVAVLTIDDSFETRNYDDNEIQTSVEIYVPDTAKSLTIKSAVGFLKNGSWNYTDPEGISQFWQINDDYKVNVTVASRVDPPTQQNFVTLQSETEIATCPVVFKDYELTLNSQLYNVPVDFYIALINPEGKLLFVDASGNLMVEFSAYAMNATLIEKASFSVADSPLASELYGQCGLYWLVAPSNGGDIIRSLEGPFDLKYYNTYIEFDIAAEATPKTGAFPLTTLFSCITKSGYPPYSFSWDFGDGSPASYEQNPTHTYDYPGTYTAKVVVVDSEGNSRSESITIGDVCQEFSETVSVGSVQLQMYFYSDGTSFDFLAYKSQEINSIEVSYTIGTLSTTTVELSINDDVIETWSHGRNPTYTLMNINKTVDDISISDGDNIALTFYGGTMSSYGGAISGSEVKITLCNN